MPKTDIQPSVDAVVMAVGGRGGGFPSLWQCVVDDVDDEDGEEGEEEEVEHRSEGEGRKSTPFRFNDPVASSFLVAWAVEKVGGKTAVGAEDPVEATVEGGARREGGGEDGPCCRSLRSRLHR